MTARLELGDNAQVKGLTIHDVKQVDAHVLDIEKGTTVLNLYIQSGFGERFAEPIQIALFMPRSLGQAARDAARAINAALDPSHKEEDAA